MELIRKILFVSACCIMFMSCNEEKCVSGDGGILLFLDAIRTQGITYYLVIRTTGFQEKVSHFELYPQRPSFDTCGTPNIQPIEVETYNDYPVEQYVKKIIFHGDREKKLEVVYTPHEKESIPLDELTFSEE